jgi:hypothetical protein
VFPFDVRQLADAHAEGCDTSATGYTENTASVADRAPVEPPSPAMFSEARETKKAADRVPSWRYRRRTWRAVALLARNRARRSVGDRVRRMRTYPWRAHTLQVLGYPFAVAGAAIGRARTGAVAIAERSVLASARTLIRRASTYPWRTRTLQVLGYPFAVTGAAIGRAWTRAVAIAERVVLAPGRIRIRRMRTYPWRARTLEVAGYPFAVTGAAIGRAWTRARAVTERSVLAPGRTLIRRRSTYPWLARIPGVPWYAFAVLIIVVEMFGYRAYLSHEVPSGPEQDQLISGRLSNLLRFQSKVLAMPVSRSVEKPMVRPRAWKGQTAAILKHPAANGYRGRKKPRVFSGKEPPSTCSRGDLFHKIDGSSGWNTFRCTSRNVWSVNRTQNGF